MSRQLHAVLNETISLLRLDRFRRFGLPLALMLIIAVLCLVNMQQAQTIAAQRELIHSLLQDSLELSARQLQQVKPRTADFKKPDLVPTAPAPDPAKPVQR